jgi:hypothetical protein
METRNEEHVLASVPVAVTAAARPGAARDVTVNKTALAKQYGVDRRTIGRWLENGWAPPAPATIEIVESNQQVPTPAHPPGRPWVGRWICGGTFSIAGVGLLAYGVAVNAHHYWSLAHEGAYLLAALGVFVDLVAVAALSAALIMWRDGHRLAVAVPLLLWLMCTPLSIIPTASSTAQLLDDHHG